MGRKGIVPRRQLVATQSRRLRRVVLRKGGREARKWFENDRERTPSRSWTEAPALSMIFRGSRMDFGGHPNGFRGSSEWLPGVIRMDSGGHPNGFRRSSEWLPGVIRMDSGGHPNDFRGSSEWLPGVIRMDFRPALGRPGRSRRGCASGSRRASRRRRCWR